MERIFVANPDGSGISIDLNTLGVLTGERHPGAIEVTAGFVRQKLGVDDERHHAAVIPCDDASQRHIKLYFEGRRVVRATVPLTAINPAGFSLASIHHTLYGQHLSYQTRAATITSTQ